MEEERDGDVGGPRGGVPAGAWFQFGFRFGAPTEAGLQPEALGEAGTIRAVRPSWSFCGRFTGGCAGARPGWLLGGAPWWTSSSSSSLPLPPDCLDLLPSETHVVLLREEALEAWPVEALLGGGGLVRLDGKEAAWRRELRRPQEEEEEEAPPLLLLPRVPGGFVAPRPPFFTPLPASLRARRLALGHEHVLLLDHAGGLFAWGGGRHGQLGHGDLESRTEPQQVEALQGVPVQEVAAGGWHSAAIGGTGDLYLWGWNESGQLALPSKDVAESQEATTTAEASGGDSGENLAQPEVAQGTQQAAFISIQAFPALLEMPHEADVCKVSCGSRHTAAVTRTGDLYTWGWGKYGQLGHQDTVSSDQPRRVCYFVDRDFCVVDVVCGPWTTYTLAVGR